MRHGRASAVGTDHDLRVVDVATLVDDSGDCPGAGRHVDDLGAGANVDPHGYRAPDEDDIESRATHGQAVADPPGVLGPALLERPTIQ